MRKKKRGREERMKMECKWEIRYTLYQCYVIVKFHRCGLVSEKKEREDEKQGRRKEITREGGGVDVGR